MNDVVRLVVGLRVAVWEVEVETVAEAVVVRVTVGVFVLLNDGVAIVLALAGSCYFVMIDKWQSVHKCFQCGIGL